MFNNNTSVPAQTFSELDLSEVFTAILRRVYFWMTLGLLVTAGIASFVRRKDYE